MPVPHVSLNQRRLSAAVAAILGLTLAPVEGGTFTWVPDTTGTWSTAANWTGGVAPVGSDPSDILIFGGSTGSFTGTAPNYTSTDDLPGAFLLNRLQLEASDGSGSQSTSNVLVAAAGSSLRFNGPNAQILQNGTGNITIKIPISSTNNLEFGGTAANSMVTLDGPISGVFDITKTGTNTFRFGSLAGTEPASDTWFGTLAINGGTIRFNNNNAVAASALRSNPVVMSAGAVLSTQFNSNETPTSLRFGTLSGSGGTVSGRWGLSDSVDIAITALQDGSFGGTISNTGGGTNTDGVLIVRGAATQTFTGTMQIAKDIVVGRGATLVLAGSASLASQTTNAAIILNGGTFRLDNTQVNNANRLRNGSISSTGLDTVGGGTFSLVGNVAGTTEQISRLQLGAGKPRSGALTINVTQPANATAPTVLNIQSYNREVNHESFTTVDFTSNSTLGAAGNSPKIVFNGSAPAISPNSLLSGSDGVDTGWATVNGSSFATHGANGVAPVTTVDFATSTAQSVLLAGNGTISSAAAFQRASLKIAPTASGQQLSITNSGSLTTSALLLAGTTDFSISNGGTGTGGWSSSTPRYAYVQAATLSLDVPLLGLGALVKSGAGTLALTNSSHSTFAQPVAINEGALRATPGSSLPQGELRLRGGVLELQGNGTTTTTFSRPLGRGTGKITWSGIDALGATLGDDRGSGGFAAIGSDATVSITSATGGTDLAWEEDGFIASGFALTFGSRTADRVVNWTSNLSLTDSKALGSVPNYNAREIRVIDNANLGVTTDRARISGVISGTMRNDLLKTGTGVLELTGTNTFSGATLVQEGTLLVNGSSNSSFLTDVRNGATLGGRGSTGAVRVEAGGTLAPGELAGFTGQMGTLTINGDLSFVDATSKLQMELGVGSYDKLDVKGGVFLAGAELVGSLLNGFLGSQGDLFFLIINDGADAVRGTFAQGSSLQFGGQTFEISYSGDFDNQQFTGGNDVVLRAVPEPSAALLLGSGLAMFAARRRKRR